MEVNHRDFHVLKQLGKGKGGYSYLLTDGDNRYVLKQTHHEPCDYYQFGNKMEAELRDYRRLQAVGIPMPRLLDADMENERILKEYVEGETVYTLICRNEMNPDFEAQVRKMCDALYPAGLNIDYFPTNFVVQEGKLFYIDYECNDFMEQWSFENWGIRYWAKTEEFLEYLRTHG